MKEVVGEISGKKGLPNQGSGRIAELAEQTRYVFRGYIFSG